MLVFYRRAGQSVIIKAFDREGQPINIGVQFLDITGQNLMRMGFIAPDDIPIWRTELLNEQGNVKYEK